MWATDDLPIYSVEKHTTGNVGWIQEKLKEAKDKYGIKIVVIDHLGFLIPKHKLEASGNYATYVGQVVRELKTLAKDERIIIILPVHVRKTDDPGMNDLKDSSSISQESDMVLMLNRERDYRETSEDYYTNHVNIYSVKNRSTGINMK
jgi:replicative DNA helicase